MKKRFKKFSEILVILFLIVGLFICRNKVQYKNETIGLNKSLNVVEIKDLNEKTFIENLAKAKDISYQEAKLLSDKYVDNNLDNENIVIKYAEKIKPYRINEDINFFICVDIKYAYNKNTDKSKILTLGEPYIRVNEIEGIIKGIWENANFNKEIGDEIARISSTGQIFIEVERNMKKNFNMSGLNEVMKTKNGFKYISEIDTYDMMINVNEL